jgi:hypothetical protein
MTYIEVRLREQSTGDASRHISERKRAHLPFIQGEFAKAYFLHFYQMYHVLKLLSFDF